MPKKGTKYATVEVDLQKWLTDEMQASGNSQAAISRLLDVTRARITEMKNGNLNTMQFLEIIVEKRFWGDFLKMAKYAQTDIGLATLKDLNFEKKLTPYQRDIYRRAQEAIKKRILEDPEGAEKLIPTIEK